MVLMIALACPLSASAGEDERAVERTLQEAAKAAATFSEAREKDAVLQWYAPDYVGIQDGQAETKEAIERWLSDYDRELKQGSTLRFISALSNVNVTVAGPLAWAFYDYLFQAVRQGELEGRDAGKCTALLRKEGAGWLIFHEHCSKTRSGLPE